MKLKLRGFKTARQHIEQVLGDLEREILAHLWQRGEASVRQVHSAFGERVAYTTVMTTLDRLYKKGVLNRRKEGRAFLYRPRLSREEFERVVVRDVIDGLLGRNAEPVLTCLVEAVSDYDRHLLDELDRLVKEKRRERRPKE